MLKDRTEITQAEYDQLLDQRLQNTGQVSGVFEIDFDRDTFSAANAIPLDYFLILVILI